MALCGSPEVQHILRLQQLIDTPSGHRKLMLWLSACPGTSTSHCLWLLSASPMFFSCAVGELALPQLLGRRCAPRGASADNDELRDPWRGLAWRASKCLCWRRQSSIADRRYRRRSSSVCNLCPGAFGCCLHVLGVTFGDDALLLQGLLGDATRRLLVLPSSRCPLRRRASGGCGECCGPRSGRTSMYLPRKA